jgi:hypothetical protein
MAADVPPERRMNTWPAIVRYDGVFDFDGMYRTIIEHLRRQNYWFYEDIYKHKPWSPIGTELIMRWHAERKLNEYYMYRLEFDWRFADFHHVEIIRDGKKLTLTKAYFWVTIRGSVLQDWQGLEDEGGKFTKRVGQFFRKQVIDREALYDYFYPLFDEVNTVQQMIQTFVNMEAARVEKYG